MSEAEKATAPSRVALGLLVALVVLSPWPFGSAHPRTTQAIAVLALVASLALLATRAGREALSVPRHVLGPAIGLWLLAGLQLVPLPRLLLVALAPGPAAVWHPDDLAAAAVLGPGFHPVSQYPEATARWLAFATGLAALALLASPALGDRRTLVRAAVATVSGGALVALYGLVARLLFRDKLYGFLTVPTIAPFGPFVSKNHFAGYVEMAACLAVGLAAGLAAEAKRGSGRLAWLDSPRASRVVFAGGAAGVLALAVPVSLSRGGTVSLAAGLVTFVLVRTLTRRRSGGRRGTLALAAAGLLLAGAGLALVLPSEARSRVTTLARTQGGGPDPFRLGVWHDSLRLAASSPLVGSGLGAFEDALPRFKRGAGDQRVEHAENDALELVADGGLVAGGLAALLFGSLLLAGLRAVRDEPHRAAQGIRAGALAGVAALLVHSAFDFNLRIPSNALLFGLLVAMVLRPAPRTVEVPGEPLPPAPGAPDPLRPGRALPGSVLPDPAPPGPVLRDSVVPEPPPREPSAPASAAGTGLRGRPLLLLLAVTTALVLALANPWVPRRFEAGPLARARSSSAVALRRQSLERDAREHLRLRPADAPAWVALAWLRAPSAAAEAAALASWAIRLDPEHVPLRRAAEQVAGAQIQPRRP